MLGYIYFDVFNPASDKQRPEDVRPSLSGLDYSPLPKMTGRSVAMGLLVSMGGLIFGYDTGQISGFLEMPSFLAAFGQTNDQGQRYFSNVRAGLIVSLLSIGTLIGALAGAPIADRIGRRISISVASGVVTVGFIVQISASTEWYQIMIGRFVAGLGVGMLSLLVPMYLAETAAPWVRGALVCSYQLFITAGILIAALFNFATVSTIPDSPACWRIVVGLGFIWVVALGCGILLFPETPRYDMKMDKRDLAAQTLCRVYGAPTPNHFAVYTQLEEIEKRLLIDRQEASDSTLDEFKAMWNAPRVPYRVLLGMLLQMFQQMTGANFFFYFGTVIFRSVSISSFVTQIILNAINFVSAFGGIYLVEFYGRRPSLILGSIWMFICLMVFASVGHFKLNLDDPQSTKGAGVVLIVFACLFIVGFATTWGPMVWAIQAELFPQRFRAKGMAMSTASNWIWNFCIGFFTPFIFNAIGFDYGYVFAACNFVAALLIYFFVIEGKNRTLEEVDTMYIEHVKPWKSTEWKAPSAQEMRAVRRRAGERDDGLEKTLTDDVRVGAVTGAEHQEHV
ncbi:hypothetical protein CDD80_5222 [Ophiocordyceps camponoti-rufipedis]|uniref:Major facilitator superfamily (MFS) profile domain-containing protein n=1 Tax=Ophiocordyceps camponoti-rufipedis TaxID=2004952 RepID=A0A2C5YUU6_9HYPO|nr:hypothetical protein CDD80_5222 [Ophiocordyceps camponoti-rufipedis]